MGIKSISLVVTVLILSFNAHAALVTHGHLTTYDDGRSNIILDRLNNVEYLRFDVLADLTYAQTLAVLDTQDGGGWHIADSLGAIQFTGALLGGTTACVHDGVSAIVNLCGYVTGWVEGDLGENYLNIYDFAWFLDDNGEADYVSIWIIDGEVHVRDYNLAESDWYAAGGPEADNPISWMLVRPAEVPVPASVWLFGSGLIGLIGLARRKARV